MHNLPAAQKSFKFLVVDDYESMRIMIADHLRQLGVQDITFATSGNEALQVLKAKFSTPQQIDFVLTDMMMENGSGIDLAKGIRADSNLKTLPILMITSKTEVNYVLEAAKAGVSSYIVKPWQIEDLAKKIVDNSKQKK